MLLFLDETGTDHKAMPYEVTGGVAVPEGQLWDFVQDAMWLQEDCFGGRLRDLAPGREFKAKQLLSKDIFKFAAQGPDMQRAARRDLARQFLRRGVDHESPRRDEFTAYGQACICYVGELLQLCGVHDLRVFAVAVDRDAPRSRNLDALRRDISFLFERYYYYLEDMGGDGRGLIVFDELERSLCRGLIGRMESYFLNTHKGRARSQLIIPEPFFVHSDLTTGIQLADLVVYIINWGYRYGKMDGATRPELEGMAKTLTGLVHKSVRPDADGSGNEWAVWSIKHVDDLRARDER